jgi:4-alpha-glucanotransferase
MLVESGAQVTAEDLGLIPDFVRASLARLGVPGYKVLRWERDWHANGQPLMDPATFSPVSVATTSTHDIDPVALWWETLDRHEQAELLARLELPARINAAFDDHIRDELLRQAYRAGSDLLLLPIQDIFGWRDRVNVPATVTDENWTWRLPLSVEALGDDPEARERAAAMKRLAIETGRLPPPL